MWVTTSTWTRRRRVVGFLNLWPKKLGVAFIFPHFLEHFVICSFLTIGRFPVTCAHICSMMGWVQLHQDLKNVVQLLKPDGMIMENLSTPSFAEEQIALFKDFLGDVSQEISKWAANELFWDAISLDIYFSLVRQQGSKVAGAFQLDSQKTGTFSEVERTTSFSGIYVHQRWWSNKRKEKTYAAAKLGGFGILRCFGSQLTLDLKFSPWRKFGELTKVFVDHSWFILILELVWFAAPFLLCTLQNDLFGHPTTFHQNRPKRNACAQLVWSGLTRLFRLDDDGAEMVEAYKVKVDRCPTKGYPL